MKHRFGSRPVLAVAVLTCLAWAVAPPEFTAAGIVRGSSSATILVPGEGISIYGHNMNGSTSVLIGGIPAKMLYISENQLNLIVPPGLPENPHTEVRVVVDGVSSAPAFLPAGFENTTVALAEPAFANGPVWLKATLPLEFGHSTAWPAILGPAGFGCNEVEVRRDGKLLPLLPGSDWHRYGVGYSGNICGGSGRDPRLPLHLLYRFDTPGTYEVRYTLRDMPFGSQPGGKIRAQSVWTSIVIGPPDPAAKPAQPDDAALYDPDPNTRRLAMNLLNYEPEDIASNHLLALIHEKGPTDVIVGFLLRQPAFREAHAAEIAEASVPYLKSDSVLAMEGAVAALRSAPRIDALLAAADHVTERASTQTGADLAQILVDSHDPRAHAVLRRLIDRSYLQIAHALASFRDPADLPALAALFPASGENGAFLPELLYSNYGKAAVPYLKAALNQSPPRFTARNLAAQLMAANDPAGFSFAEESLTSRGNHIDMIQLLKSQFPELANADEPALLAFVRARLQ